MSRKTPLTRISILDTAMTLSATLALEALSIRKLATELGVSPMAIYRHYENKDALLTDMLDSFIDAAMVVPEQALDWPLWLETFALGMQQALLEQPSWLNYINRMPLGDSAVDVMQAFCAYLRQAGFSQVQAEQAFFSCLQLVLGSVCLLSVNDEAAKQQANLALKASLKLLNQGLLVQLG